MKSFSNMVLLVFIFLNCEINTRHISDKIYKDELIKIAKRIYEKELTSGTGGDISVRIKGADRMIIKSTGACLGDLTYQNLTTMNLKGDIIESDSKPSHEAEIHCRIYVLDESIGAIMHMHSPYATAWATVGKLIPAVTQQSVNLLKDAAIVPYYTVGSAELVEAIVHAYSEPETCVVMMENHGVFVVGKNLYDLLYKAEVVENTARIAYFCQLLGTPVPFKL